MDDVLPAARGQLAVSSFCSSSTARLRRCMPRTSARNSSARMETSGLSRPAAAKMSSTPSGATARETICRTAWSTLLVGPALGGGALGQRGADGLEERDVVTDAHGLGVRHREGEGRRKRPHRAQAAPARGRVPERQAAGRADPPACPRPMRSGRTRGRSRSRSRTLKHRGDGLLLVEGGLPGAAALGVGGQRPFQLVGEAQVVDDETTGLASEHAVDPRDGLQSGRGRASACRRNIVCRLGASKPVSHMSRTSTIWSRSAGSRNHLASASCCGCAAASRAGRPSTDHYGTLSRSGNANTKRLFPWLGLSSGVRLTNRGVPVLTATYCRPSTA